MKIVKSLLLTMMLAGATYAGDMVQPLPPPPPEATATTAGGTAKGAIQEIILTIAGRLLLP